MHHTQIIKGLLDILNSNHEKLKLTNEQVAIKNEANKLVNWQKGHKRMGICNGGSMNGQVKISSYDAFRCVKTSDDYKVKRFAILPTPLDMNYKQEVPTETYQKVIRKWGVNGFVESWCEWVLIDELTQKPIVDLK